MKYIDQLKRGTRVRVRTFEGTMYAKPMYLEGSEPGTAVAIINLPNHRKGCWRIVVPAHLVEIVTDEP